MPSEETQVFDLVEHDPSPDHFRWIFALAGAALSALGLLLSPWLGILSPGAIHNQLLVGSFLIVFGASFVAIAIVAWLADQEVQIRVGPSGVAVRYRSGRTKEISWEAPGLRGSISHAVMTSPDRAAEPPKGWVLTVRDDRTRMSVGTSFEAGNAIEGWVRRLGISSAGATVLWVGRGRDASVLELFEFARAGPIGIAGIASKRVEFPRERGRPPESTG